MDREYTYSFIIPHKNCPDLLQRCVDSIPERGDVQIIVVDDNSDDGKKPALKEHKGLKVVLLDAKRAKGAGRARNVGMNHAEGKWLLFADADDYYENGFLVVLDGYTDSGVDVVYFSYEYRDSKTGETLPPQSFRRFFDGYDGSKQLKDQIRFHHNVPWTKMVSREYLKKHRIYFEETPNGNDILFSMKVGYYTKDLTVIKQPLYVYLRNEGSIINSRDNANSAMCRLTHLIQLNHLYKFLGYPQWRTSVFKRIAYKSFTLGVPFIMLLLKNIRMLYDKRDVWTKELINNS